MVRTVAPLLSVDLAPLIRASKVPTSGVWCGGMGKSGHRGRKEVWEQGRRGRNSTAAQCIPDSLGEWSGRSCRTRRRRRSGASSCRCEARPLASPPECGNAEVRSQWLCGTNDGCVVESWIWPLGRGYSVRAVRTRSARATQAHARAAVSFRRPLPLPLPALCPRPPPPATLPPPHQQRTCPRP